MTAYLVANTPRRPQYRKPRRANPTGTCVLHSAENVPDLRPPDEGAEKIASFIQGRTDAGSYHKIADQDTRIQLVPFEWEAFGDGTGSNPWAIHLSLALRAEDWPKLTDQQRLWYMAGLATCAREASDWLRVHHRIVVPVRRLTKASAREPGFCSHQDRETWFGTPGRRTDPWRNDEGMWHLFLSLYADATKNTPPASQENDDVYPLISDLYALWRKKPTAALDDFAGLTFWLDHGKNVGESKLLHDLTGALAHEAGF